MTKALATKNVAAVVLAATMIVGAAFAFTTTVKADTVSDLQAQVQALLAQIQALQGSSTSTTSTSCYTFTRNETVGMTGSEVMQIQKFLNAHGYTVAVTGAGSAGNETSYFGGATKAAVVKFQAAQSVSPTSGYWGPLTRAAANALCTTTGGTTGGSTGGTTTGGALMVSAAAQPANGLAVQGASRVPFTTFTLTNNSSAAVTVNSVSIMRTGPANDSVFTGGGVVLLDEMGNQLGVQRTLNSDHTVAAGDPFVINPGQTKTITVAANMGSSLSSYAGQVVGLTVTGINTSSTVSGSLPISGAMHTVNASLTIGTVTPAISSFDPNAAQTKNIGDTGVRFTGVRFTAGSAEDVKLYSVRFRLNGSVSAADLANVKAVVDGTSYAATVSTDGRYYTVSIPGGLLIQKGFSKDVYLQGDIVGINASGRVAEFDIDKKTDVYFVGQSFGYGIQPDATTAGSYSSASTHGSAITTVQPWFQGSTISINGASITTIGKANEVGAQNIAVNVPNQVLGGFATDLKGEPMNVQQMVFGISTTGTTSSNQITSVSIVDENGAVVAGPVDAVGNILTFTNSVTFPLGRHVYTLKGKIPASGFSNNATVALTTNPSTQWTSVTGQTTGNTISLSSQSMFIMNTMTVRAANLAVSVSPTPAAQNIVAGSQDVVLANYQFDASQSGEDIRISNVPVTVTLGGGAVITHLTTCRIYDGSTSLTTGSNVQNPAAAAFTMTLDNSLTVAKGTVKTLSLKCNVSSSSANSETFAAGVTGAQIAAISASGVTSSNTVTPTGSTATGQTMTIGAASLAVSLDSSSPSATLVAGGTTGVTLGAYKFHASNDSVNLQRVGLVLTSGSAADLTNVTLWSGSTQIGVASFAGGSSNATSTFATPILLAKDTDVVITIKGDIAAIGTSQAGTAGDTIKVDVDINGGNTQGTGTGSGGTVNASGSTAVSGVVIYRSFPTVTRVALSSSALTTGTVELYRFNVTANSTGNGVVLNQVTVNVATSTNTASNGSTSVNNLKIVAYDSACSNVIGQGFTNGVLNTAIANLASGDNKIAFSNPVQIAGGTTLCFKVMGDVSQVAGTSGAAGYVSTKLSGDSAIYALNTAANADTNRNFVWSANTQSISSLSTLLTTSDWTGGFLVAGLPTSGTDVTTLTK